MITYPFTVKDIYKNPENFSVEIERFQKGNLYYHLHAKVGDTYYEYEFAIPVAEAGEAEFPKRDGAKLYRKYIESAMKDMVLQPVSHIGISIGNVAGISKVTFLD